VCSVEDVGIIDLSLMAYAIILSYPFHANTNISDALS
jgi:hypothetical protein